MTQAKAHGTLVGVILFIVLIIFGTCFSGCLTEKNLPKHNDKFPLKAAEYAAKRFPVRDSVGKPVIDSIKRANNADYSLLIDSITKESETWWVPETEQPFEKIVCPDKEDLLKRNEQLINLIAKLRREYKPCKPDSVFISTTKWRVDGAALEAANIREKNEKQRADKSEKELQEWRQIAKVRFWIISTLSLIILLFIGIAVGKYLKRIQV